MLEKCEQVQAAIRDATSGAGARASSSATTGGPITTLDVIQKWARILLFVFFTVYMVPFIGAWINMMSYKAFVVCAVVSYGISLFRSHGMIQFNVGYLQRVMLDPTSM